jgi:hypothetical protein
MKNKFEDLKKTFKSSIKTWDYFVNWKKVFDNSSELEISLNKLNYLLGKKDFDAEFKKLYEDSPEIVKVLPVLLAVRENVLEIYDKDKKTSKFFDFKTENTNSVKEYTEFIKKTGLIKLFNEDGIKNLVDYTLGVEVGLDSNGRKNRGGQLMEEIVGKFIDQFCKEKGLEYLEQANAKKIKERWNYEIKVNKSSRSFDFAVYNPKTKKIKLFETNFYNGGGSKLKAVCGEFKSLFNELKKQNIDFIWITDGLGWNTTLRPLEETFNHNDYVFNLSMLEDNILNTLDW